MSLIDKAKEYFLSNDIDEETREENAEQIREWEAAIIQHEAYADWQDHDITKLIASKARARYVDIALRLSNDRSLTAETRATLWAGQDAALWILSITSTNAREMLEDIQQEIRSKLPPQT